MEINIQSEVGHIQTKRLLPVHGPYKLWPLDIHKAIVMILAQIVIKLYIIFTICFLLVTFDLIQSSSQQPMVQPVHTEIPSIQEDDWDIVSIESQELQVSFRCDIHFLQFEFSIKATIQLHNQIIT